jgi:hypothetical protein
MNLIKNQFNKDKYLFCFFEYLNHIFTSIPRIFYQIKMYLEELQD